MYDDMRVDRDIMVPMRDGIKLACDVYRPAAAGQVVPGAFPVILERTPYGKGQTSRIVPPNSSTSIRPTPIIPTGMP